MEKTTVYLERELKAAVRRAARVRGVSEAEVIRASIRAAVLPDRPAPSSSIFDAVPFAEQADELLAGFGER